MPTQTIAIMMNHFTTPPHEDLPEESTWAFRASDLLGRKVLLNTKGKCVRDFSSTMLRLVKPYALQCTPMGQTVRTLARHTAQWNVLTTLIMLRTSKTAELLESGKGKESNDFYSAKIQTAEFYFARLLPRADCHYSAALAPTSAVMQMPQELFQMA